MGHRIPIIHVKDLLDLNVRGRFTSVGTGLVDCYGCIEAAAAKGTKWMVVEQDRPNNLTHFESAIASIYNLREVGLAANP
jgi:sugar phosphate isomerase/epimerase